MCKKCCENCSELVCVCKELFQQLDSLEYFTSTIGVKFEGLVEKEKLVFGDKYTVSSDAKANRKESKLKKKEGKEDFMYHSTSIKRKFIFKGKSYNLCIQLSNQHFRILMPCWELRREIFRFCILTLKKKFDFKITSAYLVCLNVSCHYNGRVKALDLFDVKRKFENIGRTIRKNFRCYYCPKTNPDKAVTIQFHGKQGKMRIFSTGTIMMMGINDPIFFREQIEYFTGVLETIEQTHQKTLAPSFEKSVLV